MREHEFCPVGERQLAAYIENRLSGKERESFAGHAAGCAICRSELELWEQLGRLPEATPSAYFRQDFDAMLARESERLRRPERGPQWYRNPVIGWAAAAVFAVGGFFAGQTISTGQGQPEISELREEIRNMRGMVAIGLMQQQSAVERLRGVNFSERIENPDEGVVAALIQTLRTDSSVDVRLAACDALRRYSGRPRVRQSMIEALGVQDSPLVQLALIDAMVEVREGRALEAMSRLAASEDVNPAVKNRVQLAIRELKIQ